MIDLATYRPAPGKMLLLRTSDRDGRGTHELARHFVWPASGPVECNDWNPSPTCGGGLHGLPWGAGDASLLSSEPDARWIVWEADEVEVVAITEGGAGKSKAPRGVVVYCGGKADAIALVSRCAPAGTPVVYGVATAGDRGTATAGDYGTATAGDGGTATAGYGGTATAGDYGTATAGYGGTATAGARGAIRIAWYDTRSQCYRSACGEVGDGTDGLLLPGRRYRATKVGSVVLAEGGQ